MSNKSIATIARAGFASALSSTYTPLLGGPPTSPSYPVTSTLLTGGFTSTFTPDGNAGEKHFYYVDTTGNLWRWDSTNPTTAAVQILTAAAVGATIVGLQCSPDSTTLYAATSAHTILSIPTTAPYTPVVLAGSGTSGSTNGVGTAATFAELVSMQIDPLAGAYLVVWEGDTGNLRKIVIATTVVTTTNTSVGAAAAGNGFALDKAGYAYFPSPEQIIKLQIGVNGVSTLATFSGSNTGPIAVSTGTPSGRYVYLFAYGVSGGTSLIRVAVSNGAIVEGVAMMPDAVGQAFEQNGQMHFGPLGIHCVDKLGNLYQILG